MRAHRLVGVLDACLLNMSTSLAGLLLNSFHWTLLVATYQTSVFVGSECRGMRSATGRGHSEKGVRQCWSVKSLGQVLLL